MSLMGRRIETPASGHVAFAQPHDGDYRLVDEAGDTIGWLRGVRRGSRRAWSIALDYNGEFTGMYVDMAHAAQGVMHRLTPKPKAILYFPYPRTRLQAEPCG